MRNWFVLEEWEGETKITSKHFFNFCAWWSMDNQQEKADRRLPLNARFGHPMYRVVHKDQFTQ
jgi:hypothetical protein